MITHGRTGLSHFFGGSISEDLGKPFQITGGNI
jgi:nucleotide-binding universal stress UspA family protein